MGDFALNNMDTESEMFTVNLGLDSYPLLPAATKLGQGNVFTGVCDSVHRGGGVCLSACWDTTPPKSRQPPGSRHPPRSRHDPLEETRPPWEQTPPRSDTPLGADTPQIRPPPEQTPPEPDTPPEPGTPPTHLGLITSPGTKYTMGESRCIW